MKTLNVNNKRQINIDLAKFFALVFMIFIHALMVYTEDFSSGFKYVANTILGGPLSAPVFMVSMGVGLAYSKNQDPGKIFKRGVNILILAYILNIFMAPMYMPETENVKMFIKELIPILFYGDILHFAGLSFIVFSLLKRLKLNDTVIMAVGILLSLISSLISVINIDRYLLSETVGLFLPMNSFDAIPVAFPFFAWFIFPAFGYWFGNRLKHIQNLTKFYLIMGGISLLISVAGLGIEMHQDAFMMSVAEEDFYYLKAHDAILSILATIAMYAICYFIVKILPEKVNYSIVTISNSLNIIYMLSWIVIIYTAVILYCFVEEVSGFPLYLIMVAKTAISICLGVKIKQMIINRVNKKPESFLKYLNA